jgi:hypothetical protein
MLEPLNPFVKNLAKCLPRRLLAIAASKRWWHSTRQGFERNGSLFRGRLFTARHGSIVLGGPFKGMRYPDDATERHHVIPNLLGTYEMELHPWVTKAQAFDRIIDIGAADGYSMVFKFISTHGATLKP